MKTIEIKLNQNILPERFVGKKTSIADVSSTIEEPCVLTREGKPFIVYGQLDERWSLLAPAILKEVRYVNTSRLTRYNNNFDSVRGREISFGFRAERPVYNHPAGAMRFNSLYPNWYRILSELGSDLQQHYKKHSPEMFEKHRAIVEKNICSDWLLKDTVFSQGIVNNATPLDYHYDRGNIEDCWSCMAVFRSKGIRGGVLVLPELDVGIHVKNNCFLLFNGQSLVHGVTELVPTLKTDYRFSVVYFTLKAMFGLGTFEHQLKRFKIQQSKKTKL